MRAPRWQIFGGLGLEDAVLEHIPVTLASDTGLMVCSWFTFCAEFYIDWYIVSTYGAKNVKFDRISNSAFFVGANSTSYCDLTVLKAWTMIRKTFSLPGCSKLAIVEVFSRRILYTSESDKRSKKKTKCQNRTANNTPFLEDPFQSFVFFAGWCMFLASHS